MFVTNWRNRLVNGGDFRDPIGGMDVNFDLEGSHEADYPSSLVNIGDSYAVNIGFAERLDLPPSYSKRTLTTFVVEERFIQQGIDGSGICFWFQM